MTTKPITITDIAKMVGVSHSSVSRVLNNASIRISKEKRAQILDIAKRHNYVPNRSARALKTGKSCLIAIVAFDITNPFIVECVTAIDLKLSTTEFYPQWFSYKNAAHRHITPVNLLYNLAQFMDGIVLISTRPFLSDKEITDFHDSTQLPMITVLRSVDRPSIPSIQVDEKHGTRLLMDHLLDLGHEDIAFLWRLPTEEHPTACDRHGTYQEMMRERDLEAKPEFQHAVDGTDESGFEVGRRLLEAEQRPTAVICYNDMTAIGLLKSCHEHGVRVPDDLSVVSYDNIHMSQMAHPPLTTVGPDYTEIADYIGKYMIAMIEQNGAIDLKDINSKPSLVVRDSTGPVRRV